VSGDNVKGSVLIVDDEEAIRRVFTRFLEMDGFAVATAGSAEEGAALVKERGGFDVVLTDYHLPGMSGLELAEQVVLLAPAARVILLSGAPSDLSDERAKALHIFSFLAKPARGAALVAMVRDALAATI